MRDSNTSVLVIIIAVTGGIFISIEVLGSAQIIDWHAPWVNGTEVILLYVLIISVIALLVWRLIQDWRGALSRAAGYLFSRFLTFFAFMILLAIWVGLEQLIAVLK